MKYIPNAVKFGTQSRSSPLIKNMIFVLRNLTQNQIRGQIWSQNCNEPNFYQISHSEQIEHANYEYNNWN